MQSAQKIQKPFKDGLCELWSVERLSLKEMIATFNFDEETLGIKSYSQFKTLGSDIERVISIPYNNIVDKANQVMLINGQAYRIELIQKKDTFPTSLKITLSKSTVGYLKHD